MNYNLKHALFRVTQHDARNATDGGNNFRVTRENSVDVKGYTRRRTKKPFPRNNAPPSQVTPGAHGFRVTTIHSYKNHA